MTWAQAKSSMPFISVSREPATDSDRTPTLVLLHGLASDEQDLIGLASELDPALRVVSLRAPHETGYGGFAWFPIQFLPNGERIVDTETAVQSLGLLEEELASFRAKSTGAPLLLGGFSQGAMMASGVLMKNAQLIDGAWLMSGRLFPAFAVEGASPSPRRVLVQHGLYDEVLGVDEGCELAQALTKSGHDMSYHEYPMAHQISYESLSDANRWLASFLT